MTGVAVPGFAEAHDRMARICASSSDLDDLRARVLAELQRRVGFDFHVWLLTDPETSVGTSPLADVPQLPELPRLVRLKYLSRFNRWTTLDAVASLRSGSAEGAGGPVDGDGDGDGDGESWTRHLARLGVADVASAVFRDRHGCWGWLDLWRSSGAFGRDELSFLAGVLPAVSAALRRCQARTFLGEPAGQPPLGPVVLLLSPDLEVRGATPQTHGLLATLVPPGPGRATIPASAYNVAAQLWALESEVDLSPAWARVHLEHGHWVTLRAARLGGDGPPAERDIAVTIEAASGQERLGVFTRAFAFSPRETELLRHLVAGLDTREIAARMVVSDHTVQDHLKAIFDKTTARSRRALVAMVLGS
ncbi:MAG: response regulator transcription factor [Nocardioides sp.]